MAERRWDPTDDRHPTEREPTSDRWMRPGPASERRDRPVSSRRRRRGRANHPAFAAIFASHPSLRSPVRARRRCPR